MVPLEGHTEAKGAFFELYDFLEVQTRKDYIQGRYLVLRDDIYITENRDYVIKIG